MTSAVCTLGLWGPRARDVLAAVTDEDVSDAAFPFATGRTITLGSIPVLALRLSYVGELGWELHAPAECGLRLWDAVAEAGAPHGLVPAGIGVYGTTARMEKGYRLVGHELDAEHGPVEAGLALPGLKSQDFVGKAAYTQGPRGRARGDAVHADSTTARRRERVPAGRRAGPHARRRPDHRPPGPAVVRHQRGRRPVARDVPADGVPAALARRRGHRAARRVPGGALPGDGRAGGPDAAVRPRRHADEVTGGMDVLVCVKRVPAVGAEILLTADATAIDTRHLGFTIGPHEECAVEEAVRIAERTGGAAGVLTVGPPETEEQLRYALSMGADHAVRVDTPDDGAGPRGHRGGRDGRAAASCRPTTSSCSARPRPTPGTRRSGSGWPARCGGRSWAG